MNPADLSMPDAMNLAGQASMMAGMLGYSAFPTPGQTGQKDAAAAILSQMLGLQAPQINADAQRDVQGLRNVGSQSAIRTQGAVEANNYQNKFRQNRGQQEWYDRRHDRNLKEARQRNDDRSTGSTRGIDILRLLGHGGMPMPGGAM
jgi:hypothetical protein